MTHGHPHEEAEHAQHALHDPFDRCVAMTMVIIAAVLAAVKVLGHRAHNDTLRYQVQSNIHHTVETDQRNFFQAQKMRQHLYESQSDLLGALATEGGRTDPEKKKRIDDWMSKSETYAKKAAEIKGKAEKEQKEAEEY